MTALRVWSVSVILCGTAHATIFVSENDGGATYAFDDGQPRHLRQSQLERPLPVGQIPFFAVVPPTPTIPADDNTDPDWCTVNPTPTPNPQALQVAPPIVPYCCGDCQVCDDNGHCAFDGQVDATELSRFYAAVSGTVSDAQLRHPGFWPPSGGPWMQDPGEHYAHQHRCGFDCNFDGKVDAADEAQIVANMQNGCPTPAPIPDPHTVPPPFFAAPDTPLLTLRYGIEITRYWSSTLKLSATGAVRYFTTRDALTYINAYLAPLHAAVLRDVGLRLEVAHVRLLRRRHYGIVVCQPDPVHPDQQKCHIDPNDNASYADWRTLYGNDPRFDGTKPGGVGFVMRLLVDSSDGEDGTGGAGGAVCQLAGGHASFNFYGDFVPTGRWPFPWYGGWMFLLNHEMGHGLGLLHTHDYVPPIGPDTCRMFPTPTPSPIGDPQAYPNSLTTYCHNNPTVVWPYLAPVMAAIARAHLDPLPCVIHGGSRLWYGDFWGDGADADNDRQPDAIDNCPLPNEHQDSSRQTGVGDACCDVTLPPELAFWQTAQDHVCNPRTDDTQFP